MRENRKPKRTDIQALRTIAVLAVVIYHLWPEKLTGGFMGVDIFFVISGYLMTLTLMRDINPVLDAKSKLKATGAYLAEFYARRIKRLLPAASVTLLATLGLVLATGNYKIIEETSKQIAASALFVQNLFLANTSVDYLSNSDPTAVQHFWSLSLEEQFYLVWPLLLLAVIAITFHLSLVYKDKKIAGAVIPISILIAGFFIYGYSLTQTDASAAYFFTPARIWELMMGGFIAFLPQLKSYDLRLLLPWIGFTLLGYALYKWNGDGFPGWHALVPVIGTGLVLYGGGSTNESKYSFSNSLKARPIQWIGDVSYSLYLWHWPLIILLPVLFTINIEGAYSLYIKLGILALSFVLAWLSYKFVEIPAQKMRLKKRWIYIAFIAIVGVIASSGFIISSVTESRAQTRLNELRSLALSKEAPCLGARSIQNKRICGDGFDVRDRKFIQMTEIDRYTVPIDRGEECSIYHPNPIEPSDPTRYCVIGDVNAKQKIAILGDSHANQWINALNDIGKRNHIKFILLTSGSCSWLPVNAPECINRTNFIRKNNLLGDVSAVLLSVWFRYDQDYDTQPTSSAIKTAKDLTSAPLYLLEDIPPAGDQGGPTCTVRGLTCKNSIDALWAINGVRERLLKDSLIDENHIISTRDMFCDDADCYSYIGGVPVYQTYNPKDDPNSIGGNSHITGTYSLTVSGLLEEKLRKQGALSPTPMQPEPISSTIKLDEEHCPTDS